MAVNTQSRIAAVRFHKVGKLYHFDLSAYPELNLRDHVIVETARGRQLGQIITYVAPENAIGRVKPITRPATPRDLVMQQYWETQEEEALRACREAGADLEKQHGIKFIKARYNYDGSLLAFLYESEEAAFDTSRLRRTLSRQFDTRVEIRRIGSRDSAKLIGKYGACSAPRCCNTYLTEFSPVSIKMAKAQGISLNPTEITGMCGRLRCCLLYEYEQYVEANKSLPRRGRKVGTPHGEGKVIEVYSLRQSVAVYVEGSRYEVHRDDLIPIAEWRALQEKAAQSCAREGGPCECGSRVLPSAPAIETTPPREFRHPPGDRRRRPPPKPRGQRPPGSKPEQEGEKSGPSQERRKKKSSRPRRGKGSQSQPGGESGGSRPANRSRSNRRKGKGKGQSRPSE